MNISLAGNVIVRGTITKMASCTRRKLHEAIVFTATAEDVRAFRIQKRV